MDNILGQLHGGKWFSKIDFQTSYHQICINEYKIAKTSSQISYGHYEFVVLPFGLTNAHATSMTMMHDVLINFWI